MNKDDLITIIGSKGMLGTDLINFCKKNNYNVYEEKIELSDHEEEKPKEEKKKGKKKL